MKLSNNIIRTLILKPYSKFSTPSTSASSSAYSKLLVSRSHGQPYSLFIPNEATI